MNKKEKYELQIIAGIMQDISELSKDKNAANKIKETQLKLEKLIKK